MPVDPMKCAFYFSNSSSGNNSMPDNFVKQYEAVDLSSSGKTVFVENEKVPGTNVTAQKVWKDKNGNDIPDESKPGSVTVKLWRYILNDGQWKQANSNTGDGSSDAFDWNSVSKEQYPGENGEQTLNKGNNWKHEWTDLPAEGIDSNGNHVYYKYFVEEVSVEGYDTSISASQTENGWLYTVENRKNKDESYTLPETGGPGGAMYTIGGLLLAVGAAFILWYRHILKVRREGRLSSRR